MYKNEAAECGVSLIWDIDVLARYSRKSVTLRPGIQALFDEILDRGGLGLQRVIALRPTSEAAVLFHSKKGMRLSVEADFGPVIAQDRTPEDANPFQFAGLTIEQRSVADIVNQAMKGEALAYPVLNAGYVAIVGSEKAAFTARAAGARVIECFDGDIDALRARLWEAIPAPAVETPSSLEGKKNIFALSARLN